MSSIPVQVKSTLVISLMSSHMRASTSHLCSSRKHSQGTGLGNHRPSIRLGCLSSLRPPNVLADTSCRGAPSLPLFTQLSSTSWTQAACDKARAFPLSFHNKMGGNRLYVSNSCRGACSVTTGCDFYRLYTQDCFVLI
jgi:hypothetical protein